MNRSTYILLGLLVIGLIVFLSLQGPAQDSANTPAPTTTTQSTTTTDMTTDTTSTGTTTQDSPSGTSTRQSSTETTTVTYTENGFSPTSVTVQSGDTVVFVNDSNSGMWVGADQHPTHTNYDGTNLSQHCNNNGAQPFDSCTEIQTGNSWSFTFDKTGEWGYHNHVAPRDTGTVIVQ